MTAPITDAEIERAATNAVLRRVLPQDDIIFAMADRIAADAERLARAETEIAQSIIERNALRAQLRAVHDVLREFLYDGRLQTFGDRERFRIVARAVIEGV